MEKRKLFDKVKAHITRKEHTIIVGARQVGKSTLMRQIMNELEGDGEPAVWISLEHRDILTALNQSPQNLMQYLPANSGKKIVVFIDEIQYLDNPSNFLKLIYDDYSDKVKIVASGSSAFYIDEKFEDSLAGRKRIFKMHTCSFGEYLRLSGKFDLFAEYDRIISMPEARSTKISLLESELKNYIRFGGYPAVVSEQDEREKHLMLCELRDSFIKRDIKEAGVSNPESFYKLFRLLAGQSGNLLNINELANTLRIKNDTIQRYVDVLRCCCHISLVRPFFRNLIKELTKMPKVYLLDSGMRRCLLGTTFAEISPTEEGAEWENLIYRALIEKYSTDEINFWRTTAGNEVDFILPHSNSPIAIEVKRTVGAFKESKYKIFREAYPEIKLSFIEGFPLTEKTMYSLSAL